LKAFVHDYLEPNTTPRGELIDMVFLGDAPPIWRAIEHGLALVKKGIIWREGKQRFIGWLGTSC
jgi:hypothetical protein